MTVIEYCRHETKVHELVIIREGGYERCVPFRDSIELAALNPELKRPPQSFCYIRSELDMPMRG